MIKDCISFPTNSRQLLSYNPYSFTLTQNSELDCGSDAAWEKLSSEESIWLIGMTSKHLRVFNLNMGSTNFNFNFFFFFQDGTEADWGCMCRVFWHRLAEEKDSHKTKSNQTEENNLGRWSCSPLPSHQASTKELHWFAACQGQKTGNLFNPVPFTSCFLTSP